ncbi:MAG: tetratricopeptide repeat protein [Clostridia bacterium]
MNKNLGRWLALACATAGVLQIGVAGAAPGDLREGLSAFVRGQYERAADLLDLAISNASLTGAERVSALRALATAQLLAGRYGQAESAVTELLIERAGAADPAAASDLMLAGRIAKEQGRYQRAEASYREGIERLGRKYGIDHPEVAEALRQLGDIALAQGRIGEAEKLYWRAYMVGSYVGGAESSLVGAALLGLGLVRQAQKRPTESRELLLRALQIADKPPRSNGKWDRLDARDLRALQPEEREYVAVRGRIYSRTAEPSHPDFAEHLEHRAAILRALDRLDEAASSYGRAVDIRRRNFGDSHPIIAYDLKQIAEIQGRRPGPQ